MRIKRIAASVLAAAITLISITLSFAGNTASAVEASVRSNTVLPTDVVTASENNVLIGIEGEYICEIQAALDLINSYRKEACEEGVMNPSTKKPLTPEDYVPIKWSSDLEYIARIRAAEASLTMSHTRLTNKSIWFQSPNGVSSAGEVLAWNWGRTMTQGIKQWYSEKDNWVNNTGYETGHYTQMIDPRNRYVGLATFYNKRTPYPNTTAGEFSSRSGLDETQGASTGTIIQALEASKSCLSDLAVTENGNRFCLTATVQATDSWGGSVTTKGLEILSGVEWSSSNFNVIAVDSSGNLTKKNCGSATISASFDGKIYEMSYTAAHSYGSWKTVKAASCTDSGSSQRSCTVCGYVETRTENATGHNGTTRHIAAKQATCVSKGNVEYYHCGQCGKNFSDVKGEHEIKSTDTAVDSSKHVHTEVRNAVTPTASKDGYTGDTYCKDCGKRLKTGEILKATGSTGGNDAPETTGATEGSNGPETTGTTEGNDNPESTGSAEPSTPVSTGESSSPTDAAVPDSSGETGPGMGSSDPASESVATEPQMTEGNKASRGIYTAIAVGVAVVMGILAIIVVMIQKRRRKA